jgi:hypothetical protein
MPFFSALGVTGTCVSKKNLFKQKQKFEPKKKTFGGLWQSLAANSQTSMC